MKQTKVSRTRWALLALPILGAAWTGICRPVEAQTGVVTGRLNENWVCAEGGNTGCTRRLSLTDDRGRTVPLLADTAAALGHGLAGRRVSVAGESVRLAPASAEDSGLGLHARAIRALEPGSVEAEGISTEATQKPYVTLLVRFANAKQVTPKPASYVESLMGSQEPGADDYYREQSYGKIRLTGSVVKGWYNLPKPLSAYKPGGNFDEIKLLKDAVAVADRDVQFTDYYGINIVMNKTPFSAGGLGGIDTVDADGEQRSYGVTWQVPMYGTYAQSAFVHEIGHSLGFPHSSGPYNQTYDSHWDVMSYGYNTPSSDFFYIAPGTISYHKMKAGWISDARRYVAQPGSSQTIRLERLAVPQNQTDYLMAQIPLPGSGSRFYTVEARRKAGYDSGIPGEGVVLHLVDTSRHDRVAQVVDSTRNHNPNDAGAMWLPGETFKDTANHIQVKVVSSDASGYTVTIIRN